MTTAARRWPSPRWLALLLLLELPFLGHMPLVRDEVQSHEAARKTLGALWSSLHHLDAPVGPYYALLHFWIKVSESPTWMRLPSLLGVAGAIALTIWTAERLAGARAGLVTGLLLLANPASWVFASIARPYGLALCLAAATLLVTLTAPQRKLLLLVLATAMVVLQGMFVLLLVAELLWLWRARERDAALAVFSAMVLWLPLAVVSSTQSVMTSWIPHTAPVPLAEYVHELFGSTGVLSGIALVAWAAVAVVARPGPDTRPLLLVAAGPVVVLALAGVVAHVLGGRYVLHALLVVALVLGVAAASRPVAASRLLLGALLVLSLDNVVHQARTDFVQEDLPSAAAYLVAHDQPSDALLYSPDHARAAFLPEIETADPGVASQDLSADSTTDRRRLGSFYLPERSTAEIKTALKQHPRVWVIGYKDDEWRPTPNTGGDIATHDLAGWTLQSTETFGQIRLQLFTAPAS